MRKIFLILITILIAILLGMAVAPKSCSAISYHVHGSLKDVYGNPISSDVVLHSRGSTSVVDSTQTSNGDYDLTAGGNTYDLKFSIPDFMISNFFIKLPSLEVRYNVTDVISQVTDYPSQNKISFMVKKSLAQNIQAHSPERPNRVLIDGAEITEVSSLSDLEDGTWYYDSNGMIVHIVHGLDSAEPILKGWGGVRLYEATVIRESSPQSQVFTGEKASDAELVMQKLVEDGYNCIRAYFESEFDLDNDAKWRYNKQWFERMTDLAEHYDLWMIVDYHGYSEPHNYEAQWLGFWQSLITNYTNRYHKYIWEPCNEPSLRDLDGQTTIPVSQRQAEVARLYQAWIDMCRAAGDKHWIILGEYRSGGTTPYVDWMPAVTDPQNKLMAGFHWYMFYEDNSANWGVAGAQSKADAITSGLENFVAGRNMKITSTEIGCEYSYGASSPPDVMVSGVSGYSETTLAFVKRLKENYDRRGWSYTFWQAGDWSTAGLYGAYGVWGHLLDNPILFSTDFETVTKYDAHHINLPPPIGTENWFEFQGDGGATMWIDTSGIAHSGNKCLGMELSDVTLSKRNEFNIFPKRLGLVEDEIYVSEQLYLPSDWVIGTNDATDGDWYEMVAFMQETEPLWQPYLVMWVLQDDLSVPDFDLMLGGRDIDGNLVQLARVNDFPLPRGEWFKIEWHLVRHETAGSIQVWINGQEIFNEQGLENRVNSDWLTTLAKIYRDFGNTVHHKIYVDDIVIREHPP